jgi:primosomal protein N' (replication factor Y) (superfamily II helicase)
VLVQTEFPDHPVYAALREGDFARFTENLLAERRTAGFPPFKHQALLRAEAPRVAVALEFLEQAKCAARALACDVELYDPVPAAMARIAGRERAQLLVQSSSRRALQAFLAVWRERFGAEKSTAARWTLDVDPIEL